ncbi:MAG TPA: hypothetical protein VF221_06935 [Chloroflexota bacterium]
MPAVVAMHVHRYLTEEDPIGTTTWGYRVTDEMGRHWEVMVTCEAADLHSWVIPRNFQRSIRDPNEVYPSREQALAAALRWIREHGAKRHRET